MKAPKPILALLVAFSALAAGQGQPAVPGEDPSRSAVADWSGLPEAAQEALQEGVDAMQEALDTYAAHYPDRPLWQEAFRHGRRAQSLATEHPAPLRFLAEAYSRANWHGPAWNAWLDYLDRGNVLDAEATPLFSEVGQQLGYTYYQQGDLEEAAGVYRQVIDVVPFDLQAHAWMGRILLEMGQPEQAISYWQTVASRNPNDRRAEYFLELAREQARWGTRAVDAFREGVGFYEDGNLELARERFARATSINGQYAEAWAWLGRVAFETENYADARTYYERASRLRPTNETYTYFFEESGRRLEARAEGEEPEDGIEENAGGGGADEPGEQADPAASEPVDADPAGVDGQ